MGAFPGLAAGVFYGGGRPGSLSLILEMVWLLNLQMFSELEVQWT